MNVWDQWIVNGMWLKGTPRVVIEAYWKAKEAAVPVPAPTPAPTPVPQPAPTPAPAPAPAPVTGKVAFVGLNISGGENKDHTPPRGVNFDYVYPNTKQIDYLAAKGCNIMRVPVKEPRILQAGDIAALDKIVAYASSKGVNVLIDLHQYGTVGGKLCGVDAGATEALVKFWQGMAGRYKASPGVMLGVMNEPNKQTVPQWFRAATAVLAGIRSVNPTAHVLMPGTGWSGAHSFVKNGNAAAFDALPADPYLYADVHQYLDRYSTGQGAAVHPGIGATCLKAVTEWARAKKRQLALTEFGWAADAAAMKEAGDAIATMKTSADVWKIVTAWTGGAWYPDTYFTKMMPLADGLDRPQFKQLMTLRQ